MKNLLHVGCCTATIKDIKYITDPENWREYRLDIDPNVNPDYCCSMLDMWTVPADRFEMLHASHCLEHVYSHEVIPALSQFLRVLKPGGVAVISVPDLVQVAKFIVEKDFLDVAYVTADGNGIEVRPIDMLYGWTGGVANGNLGMQHRTGFSPYSLELVCKAAGFEKVEVHEDEGFAMFAVAQKAMA